jgi:hypothetical protein
MVASFTRIQSPLNFLLNPFFDLLLSFQNTWLWHLFNWSVSYFIYRFWFAFWLRDTNVYFYTSLLTSINWSFCVSIYSIYKANFRLQSATHFWISLSEGPLCAEAGVPPIPTDLWSPLTELYGYSQHMQNKPNWFPSESESESVYDWRSVSQYVLVSSPVWGSWPDSNWLFHSCGPVLFVRPLWREVGSVFCQS